MGRKPITVKELIPSPRQFTRSVETQPPQRVSCHDISRRKASDDFIGTIPNDETCQLPHAGEVGVVKHHQSPWSEQHINIEKVDAREIESMPAIYKRKVQLYIILDQQRER